MRLFMILLLLSLLAIVTLSNCYAEKYHNTAQFNRYISTLNNTYSQVQSITRRYHTNKPVIQRQTYQYDPILEQYLKEFKKRRPYEQHGYYIKLLPNGDKMVIWTNPNDAYDLLNE